jgi:hypothetical protein
MGSVMRRDCGEWQGILAMDAIGLASDDESRELQEHLASCHGCRQDAADVQRAAAALQFVDPEQVDRLAPQPVALLTPLPGRMGGEELTPDPGPSPAVPSELEVAGRKRGWLVGLVGIGTAAAAAVAVLALGGAPAPPTKTVALTGASGVRASVSLTAQSWGTHATLQESGQAPGQVLTVSMKTSAGRWWVAGSYRTGSGSGPLEVQLSCAVQSNQITEVWISDQHGHTVLNGYVG